MKSKNPTPELYLAFPKAFAALRDRIGATENEIACWLFFDQIKAYGHVHTFQPPPEISLMGVALTDWTQAGKGEFPYLNVLEGAFFLISDIEKFEPPTRYLSLEDLVRRWIPHRRSQEATISFILSRINQSRLIDFAPGLGQTELSSNLRPAPPSEWAMFDLTQVVSIEATDFPNAAINLNSESTSKTRVSTPNCPNTPPPGKPIIVNEVRNEHQPAIEGERGCRRQILENWEVLNELHPNGPDARQIHRYINRHRDPDQKEILLKTVRNRFIELRNEKKIP